MTNTPSPVFHHLNPVLPIDNMKLIMDFYIEQLGFQYFYDSTHYEAGEVNYAIICRDHLCLHFQLHDSIQDYTMPMLRFSIQYLDALYNEYKQKGVIRDQKIRETPWNTREFAFFDPNMVGLTFYEPLKRKQDH